MKTFKKIVISVLMIIAIAGLSGYLYFDQKFTPEKNYLRVEDESGAVPIKWMGNDKNALMVPIHFPKDTTTYYLQFDTGAADTEFYSKAIQKLKGISFRNERAISSFYIGQSKITSDKIKISNTGKALEKNDPVKIIGTLGADILENRKTMINFRDQHIVFNMSQEPDEFRNNLMGFKFKKRKIIINGNLKGKDEKFLYDSGTSAYELLTNKENWEILRLPQSKVKTEKAQSRPHILITHTTGSHELIGLGNRDILLSEVTYVEGFSQTQYMLMKFSGMTGMLGNKIFLNKRIYIDCSQEKMGIE
ncbi:hypothetical protein [Chryseobacterium sp. BIGb0232]|uniref:hypothetical protein n=1 Tax=Chryseobacterium sp. BIGb0232 TaxID=2940598 RepID=UPI000F4991E3|nr:hypothetical protein [Chryseobacterium sp. BIGb0232]MCS4304945.1 hypothetical protein [Chryseobacterium sp. BIGb0232]ROS08239.1 hypothetical protein EDF65_4689 [Chryseobacterium nakagawai]